jgi:hypothetical protein
MVAVVLKCVGRQRKSIVCGKIFLSRLDEMIVFTRASCSDYIVFNS